MKQFLLGVMELLIAMILIAALLYFVHFAAKS
jgi:hypothetical protein